MSGQPRRQDPPNNLPIPVTLSNLDTLASPARVELLVRPPAQPGHLTVQADGLNELRAAIDAQIPESRARYGVTETRLYLACPWVMAATLGWHLSSVGRLVAHEADVGRSSYRAACQLA